MSTPTTELGFSYEYAVDINTGTLAAPVWTNIRFISAVDPQVTPVTQDAATYMDKGAPNMAKTSESWTLAFTVQVHRVTSDGKYLPEVEKMKALEAPTATGNAAVGNFRWYDDPALGTPNPDDAFSGVGTISIARGQTGNDGIGSWTVTVTGQGRRTQITNPSGVVIP